MSNCRSRKSCCAHGSGAGRPRRHEWRVEISPSGAATKGSGRYAAPFASKHVCNACSRFSLAGPGVAEGLRRLHSISRHDSHRNRAARVFQYKRAENGLFTFVPRQRCGSAPPAWPHGVATPDANSSACPPAKAKRRDQQNHCKPRARTGGLSDRVP